mmetsp:Transcript_86481/g.192552  ORF Transcript_86481/g.192552 Transcript_86481/m.192552 type:complete len:91 (+) Transcript_86481:2-274(+)
MATAMEVLAVIERHHKNRGLGLPEDSAMLRRPRTIFFSPETVDQAQHADVLWQLDTKRKTVVEIGRGQINERFEADNLQATWQRPAWLDP